MTAGKVEEGERPYNRPHFGGTRSTGELLEEAERADFYTHYFDLKFRRSRELLVFMEETKIWQDVLQDCIDRAGVNATKACLQLHKIVDERNIYYNSNFNAALRPQLSPGIPVAFERIVQQDKPAPDKQ